MKLFVLCCQIAQALLFSQKDKPAAFFQYSFHFIKIRPRVAPLRFSQAWFHVKESAVLTAIGERRVRGRTVNASHQSKPTFGLQFLIRRRNDPVDDLGPVRKQSRQPAAGIPVCNADLIAAKTHRITDHMQEIRLHPAARLPSLRRTKQEKRVVLFFAHNQPEFCVRFLAGISHPRIIRDGILQHGQLFHIDRHLLPAIRHRNSERLALNLFIRHAVQPIPVCKELFDCLFRFPAGFLLGKRSKYMQKIWNFRLTVRPEKRPA